MEAKIHYEYVHREDGVTYFEVWRDKRKLYSDQPNGIGASGQMVRIDVDAELGYITQDDLANTLVDRVPVKRASASHSTHGSAGFPGLKIDFYNGKMTAQIEKVDGVKAEDLVVHLQRMRDRILELPDDYLHLGYFLKQ